MEVARLMLSAAGLIESVRNILKEDRGLKEELDNGLEALKEELAIQSAVVKKARAEANQGTEPEEWFLQLQNLTYQIVDFIYEREEDTEESGSIRRVLKMATVVLEPRRKHIKRINYFHGRIRAIGEAARTPAGQQSTPLPSHLSSDGTSVAVTPRLLQSILTWLTLWRGLWSSVFFARGGLWSSASPAEDTPVAHLVGMEKPIGELKKLLLAADESQGQLKVISILGCSGLGKTNIVRQLYNDTSIIRRFRYRAWVEMPLSADPSHVVTTLLHEILQQVRRLRGAPTGGYEQLTTDLQEFLRCARYLVTIDGLQEHNVWKAISKAFPENGLGSRVVVTTRNRSVAMEWSSGRYLYTMRGLGYTDRVRLFWEEYGHNQRSGSRKDKWLETFFAKSDGLPLVLLEGADFLRCHGQRLAPEPCHVLGKALGNHVAGRGRGFEKTRRALARCWDSLPEQSPKMCMLSVVSFPKGHVIKSNDLIRRWIAEKHVVSDKKLDEYDASRRCLDDLLDVGVVEPVPHDAINTKVERCQVHGLMLEFLLHRSLSWNFLTLVDKGKVVRGNNSYRARHLAVHSDGDINREAEEIGLSCIWSLTVRNTSNSLSLELERCKLLRILDLEGCTWVGDIHLLVIARMLHLKYLNLRITEVTRLPKAFGNLICLETLDVRQTQVGVLPLEVLMLPELAHLFGAFELPPQLEDDKTTDELNKFLIEEKGKLQTLSGFQIYNGRCYEQILRHAKWLRKVKMWLVPTISTEITTITTTSDTATTTTSAAMETPATTTPSTSMETPAPTPPRRWATAMKVTRKVLFLDQFKKNRDENGHDVVGSTNGCAPQPPVLEADSLAAALETRFIQPNSLNSLSIDLGGFCKKFLDSILKLKDTCAMSSIKIRGELEKLPESTIATLTLVRNINKLHLCNTGLSSEDLAVLQSLHSLISLKLVEESEGPWQGNFVVNTGGFPCLQRLCFCGPKLPSVEFHELIGTEYSLLSLQLICDAPVGRQHGVTGIDHLQNLEEVILHRDASPEKIEAWTLEADKLKNRPFVKKTK